MTITNLTYKIYINFSYQLVFQTRSNIKTSNSRLPNVASHRDKTRDILRKCKFQMNDTCNRLPRGHRKQSSETTASNCLEAQTNKNKRQTK